MNVNLIGNSCSVLGCTKIPDLEHHNFINNIELISFTCKDHYDNLGDTIRELQKLWRENKKK